MTSVIRTSRWGAEAAAAAPVIFADKAGATEVSWTEPAAEVHWEPHNNPPTTIPHRK
ncbi:hypothetical protein D3C76_1795750 [compost metagenome]